MDNSLRALCDAIKKILVQLKPQKNQLSFIINAGRNEQGKSALLKQSSLEEIPVFGEEQAKIYFNSKGIIVELGENWIVQSKGLLQDTFKQLNKCNPYIKITGFIFCVDINTLLRDEAHQFAEERKAHLQLLQRMGVALGYPVELAIVFTKMDTLAGFAEFYQMDHATDVAKPLGFSLDCLNQIKKKTETYSNQFNHLVEMQGQQVINKMHPARSTIKRSLIREFPLQLASLGPPTQALVQGIQTKLFHLHSVYFASAEQKGASIDRINKKIQHEYALIVQDTFPQSTNYRAYFVEGSLKAIQDRSSQAPHLRHLPQKPLIAAAVCLAGISLFLSGYHYYQTAHVLDEASKELLAYDAVKSQGGSNPQSLYHLSKAAETIDNLASDPLSFSAINQLKLDLKQSAAKELQGHFLPSLIGMLEEEITSPNNTPIVRYKALKIYLMLNDTSHFSLVDIEAWFTAEWKKQKSNQIEQQLALLRITLEKPAKLNKINQQVVNDARNYLNALPNTYLYYSLAKEHFPNSSKKIEVEGFQLLTSDIPFYYTKAGYAQVVKSIAEISERLNQEHWVLEGENQPPLQDMLMQAYGFDYVTWWQNFMRKSQPIHYSSYQQGKQIAQQLQRSDALFLLLNSIQQETKPDLTDNNSEFNSLIASKFTDINLISLSSTKELSAKVAELERFVATLSVINDGGKTAFTITRTRFNNENSSDPIGSLFSQAKQLPDPLSRWVEQLAGDSWVLLIQDSKQYINYQWQETVYKEFQNTIAKRYPFDATQQDEISMNDFNHFFSTKGTLNTFTEQFIKPFLDISSAEWKPKAVNNFVLPISTETLDEIIRANIITNMFFPNHGDEGRIDFSMQKINLDPVVASLNLEIGHTKLMDNQNTESLIKFTWPQPNAKLSLDSIEGNHYELAEEGSWAIFKLLEKVNVLIDEQDSSSLQIVFEVNSNSGRYLLKTNNQVNPFTPGILNGFKLTEAIV